MKQPVSPRKWSGVFVAGVLLIVCAIPPNSYGNEKGGGSFRAEYQFLRTSAFDSSIGDIDIGQTDGHSLLFSVDYALTDRWSIMASLPWIRRRHTGALPHDPIGEFQGAYTPPDLRRWDTGEYHSSWQDLYVGVRYFAKDGPLTIEPFVSYGFPVSDYPIYAHSAVGRHIWHMPVGAAFSYKPHFSDFFFSWDIAYVFTEKSLGVDISHWLIHGNASYFLTPRFAPKIFFVIKHGTKGLDFPDDYDVNALNDEKWYNHDRMIKHNFINAGLGFDWIVNDRYQASATVFKMVRPDQVNLIDYAWTVGITYYW